MKNFLAQYKKEKTKIKYRLEEFKNLSEKAQFKEFLFCLLTPQSNAQRCWQAVEQISKLKAPTEKQIFKILSKKTRFHKTKTARILQAKKTFKKILPLLKNKNILELRNNIEKEVNGFGLKETSHFLRNIGKSDNQIAILDRHILKNLYKYKLIEKPKIKSPKHYLEIEQIFLAFSNKIKIPSDELDLLWWSQENGELFK